MLASSVTQAACGSRAPSRWPTSDTSTPSYPCTSRSRPLGSGLGLRLLLRPPPSPFACSRASPSPSPALLPAPFPPPHPSPGGRGPSGSAARIAPSQGPGAEVHLVSCAQWSERLEEEMWRQGDVEQERDMKVPCPHTLPSRLALTPRTPRARRDLPCCPCSPRAS